MDWKLQSEKSKYTLSYSLILLKSRVSTLSTLEIDT